MAALLPKAQESAKVVAAGGGKLALEIGGKVIKDRKDRVAFLKENAGVSVFDAKLDAPQASQEGLDRKAPCRRSRANSASASAVRAAGSVASGPSACSRARPATSSATTAAASSSEPCFGAAFILPRILDICWTPTQRCR
jgi:hypothetical protein